MTARAVISTAIINIKIRRSRFRSIFRYFLPGLSMYPRGLSTLLSLDPWERGAYAVWVQFVIVSRKVIYIKTLR